MYFCSDNFNSKSDIDLLINFDKNLTPLQRGENWWTLFFALKDILKRDIDLLTENSLKNNIFIDALNKTKILIYEKETNS